MMSNLERSVRDALQQPGTDSADVFSALRKVLLHNRDDVIAKDSLPDVLCLRMLKQLTTRPPSTCKQVVECIRILGVGKAAMLSKADPDVFSALQTLFQDQPEFAMFNPPTPAVAASFLACPVGNVQNAIAGPDTAKAQEVTHMQNKYSKKWPHLLRRFSDGQATSDSDEVLQLVLETVSYILTPINAADRIKVSGDGEDATGEPKPVIVVIGITGAGKSTLCNWLAGKTIEKHQVCDKSGEEGTELRVLNATFAVGQGSFDSKTFAPNVEVLEDFVLIDFPGLCDTSGIEIRIGMDIAFREMVNLLSPAHVLALLPIQSFEAGRGTLVQQQISKLQRLLPTLGASLGADRIADEGNASTWKIGVTKCDKDFVMKPKSLFKQAAEFIAQVDANFKPPIVNINEEMFGKSDAARETFISHLLEQTRTPTGNASSTQDVVRRVFGYDSGKIESDCLNPNDIEWFGRHFMSAAFEDKFIEHDVRANRGCESIMTSWSSDAEATWQHFSSLIDGQVSALKAYTDGICNDSESLINSGRLSLERRSVLIAELCKYKQCRLKSCFVQAEEKIMMHNLKQTIELNKELYDSAQTLREKGFFRGPDFEEVVKVYERNTKKMEENARELGFMDAQTLVRTMTTIAGAGVTSVGVVAAGVTVCQSTTLAGYMAGTGSVSAGFTAAISSAGIVLLIGATLLALGRVITISMATGDTYSTEMKDKLLSAFEALVAANVAATNHKKALTAITSTLRSLEVPLRD